MEQIVKSNRSFPGSMRKQGGLSLIELMIALTLGSIVTVGVVQLFVANSQTYKLLQGQSRMQESARFAHEFIGRAVRQAGYKGCYSTNKEVSTTLLPSKVPYEFDLRSGLQGFEGTAFGTWLPDITMVLPRTVAGTDTNVFPFAAGTGIDSSKIVSSTDIVTTRNMSGNEARLLAPITDHTLVDFDVKIPAGGNDFVLNHIAFIGDCEKGTLFRVTDVDPATGGAGDTVSIGHDSADADDWNNTFPRLASVNYYDTDTIAAAVESHTFYIAPGAGVNNLNNPVLSLWRKSGLDAPVELVEGVENLQILYGVDTDFDATPNQYITANLVTDFEEVVTLRVSVTVNSVDDVGSKTAPTHGCTVQACITGQTYDGLIRRTFTQTIHLRNRG
jgi:type IV pilus assembly protein PilW